MKKLLKYLLIILLLIVIPQSFYIKTFEKTYIMLIAVLYIIYFLRNNSNIKLIVETPMKYYLVFLCISIVSELILFASNRDIFGTVFWPYIRVWIYFILMMIVISTAYNEEIIEKIVSSIIISSILPNIIGLIQLKYDVFTIVNSLEGERRIGSTFSHPNFYAYYIMLVIICLMYRYKNINGAKKRRLFTFYIAINVLLLIFTYARTPLIAGIIIFIVNYFRQLYTKNNFRAISIMSFSIILLIIVSILILNSSIYLNSRFNIYDNIGSFTWRLGKWESAIRYWIKDVVNIIFGCGWMTAGVFSEDPSYMGYAMHNELLRILFDTGILGFAAYLLFIEELIRKAVKSRLELPKRQLLFSLVVLFTLGCLNDNILTAPENSVYILILFVSIYSASRNKSEVIASKTNMLKIEFS